MTPELAALFRDEFAQEWPRVVGATLRAFGDLELAEDSAQEAFLRAHALITAGETITNLGAWATTSAQDRHRLAAPRLGSAVQAPPAAPR